MYTSVTYINYNSPKTTLAGVPFSLYGNELLCFPTEEKLVGEVHVQLQSHPAHSAHALQPELALLLLLPDILHPLICHRVFSEISKTFNCRFANVFVLVVADDDASSRPIYRELSKIQTKKYFTNNSVGRKLISFEKLKSNKSISRNFILTKFHFFAILKMAKNQYLNWGKSLKLPKMQFHKKKF